MNDEKTMGQVAYEAFHGAYDQVLPPLEWREIAPTKQAAWHAASTAVLAQPHRGSVHGPCEMRDYDYITLARPHIIAATAEGYGRGGGVEVPEGARLYMVKPEKGALGVSWETGSANPIEAVLMLPAASEEPAFVLYSEAIAHIRRTRVWVRDAEEMAPREAASMLDTLAATLETARELMKQGGIDAALSFLRSQDDDL